MNKRMKLTWLSLALLLSAAGAWAQTAPTELEIGFRWLDMDGNEGMYRTQINEREGLLLKSFSLTSADYMDNSKAIDHIRITANDMGAGPFGVFNLEAGKSKMYNLRMAWRSEDHYSELPFFANPLLSQGITPGQHTYDRKREMFDMDVELLPGGKVVPFVGFSWNKYEGLGTTTYHTGQDEFRLNQDLVDTEQELRAGATFNFGPVYGQVTQGWRDYSGKELYTLSPGEGSGNNTFPVLDQPVTISGLTRETRTEGGAPFTNAFVGTKLWDRVKLVADYSKTKGSTDDAQSEVAGGSFVSFPMRLYYKVLDETTRGSADSEMNKAGARAEIGLWKGADLVASYWSYETTMGGAALLNDIYYTAVTFGGVDMGAVRSLVSAENAYSRDEDVVNLRLNMRTLGPFSAYVSYQESDQSVRLSQSAEEISAAYGSQQGEYNRNITTYDLGGSFKMKGFQVLGSWRKDEADNPVLRTDYMFRDRYRLRAAYATPSNFFRVGATGELTEQDNDRQGIGYDGTARSYIGDFELNPWEMLRFYGSYSVFMADSRVSYRLPQNFWTAESMHEEDGTSYEAGLNLKFKPVTFDAGVGRFENKGTLPFKLDRYRVRAVFNVMAHTGIAAEWSNDQYDELGDVADFDANRYGLYLKWSN